MNSTWIKDYQILFDLEPLSKNVEVKNNVISSTS